MRGKYVERRFGWDTHGLPIEALAQDALGVAGAPEIKKLGIDKFNEQCRSMVLKYVSEWRSLMQSARATLTIDEEIISANCTMQVVRDSMLVISVMPMLGIEVYRIEATPDELIAINKLNHQYLRTDYQQVNRYVTPPLRWEDLQQIASNELPGGPFVGYAIGEKTIALKITYPEKQTDVPVRMLHIDLSRYEQVVVENL